MHEGVDVVSLGFIGELEVRHLRNHQHLCAHSDLIEPRHHKRLTTCAGCHHALTIHRSGDVIVSEEHGFVSHVARGAIAVHSSHDDLLLGAFPLEHGLFRVNLEVQHLGSASRITRRPSFEPADNGFIERTLIIKHFTASVRHTAGSFFKQQTVVRQGEVDTAT